MTRQRGDAPLPLRTQQHSRTRPHRRRPAPPRPPASGGRQRALNRWTMIMGVLVGVSALAVAVISRSNDDGGSAFVPVAGAVTVEVVDIVDGDTLHVETVDGQLLTVRLFGVDTPERGEPCFTEATNRLRELAGDRVQLLADTRLQDFAGRELRYVYAENGALIDAILIGEGFAVAWTDDGAFRHELVTIEAQATAAGIGCLWSS